MDRQLLLEKLVEEELERIEALYRELQSYAKNLPRGSLLNRNGHFYWAYREGDKQFQKPIKNNYNLLLLLRVKAFMKRSMPILHQKIVACKNFLQEDRLYNPALIFAGMKAVYRGDMGCSIFLSGDINAEAWLQEEYERNDLPFEREHFTAGNLQVRSKAEAMIGTELEHRRMLFRPEPKLLLGDETVCPDFEVFLPNRQRRVYIEHFGKMDEPGYLTKTMHKLILYSRYGLYLGINFFFTWETRDNPLNTKQIKQCLDRIEELDQIA